MLLSTFRVIEAELSKRAIADLEGMAEDTGQGSYT
jgi:hypothetical protein